MPKAILIVQSRPVSPEREADYNDWYDNRHLAEVCAVPGFTAARRYKLSTAGLFPPPAGTAEYVAVYELDTDDIGGVLKEMVARTADGRIFMSDAIEMDPPPSMTLYEAMD